MRILCLFFLIPAFFGLLPAAHAAPGDLDPLDANVTGNYSSVFAPMVQSDGKLILAGDFSSVLGVPRGVARLNVDGTLDATFDPNPRGGSPMCVTVQSDGRILVGGWFTVLHPGGVGSSATRPYIARVNADGTLDAGFNPWANYGVLSIVEQPDGKLLLGGYFTTLQPNGMGEVIKRHYIARVNADGSVDPTFDPNPDSMVLSVALQPDGKILLGGYFTALQPNGQGAVIARKYIARLNTDGSLDPEFDPKANASVHSVVLQANGKVLLGGHFISLQPNDAPMATARRHIARVNADGTLDTGFDPSANGSVYCMAPQADGKVLLGGTFTSFQPNGELTAIERWRIARVNADGSLDGFDPKPNGLIESVAQQADGKVLLSGWFTNLQPNGAGTATARVIFARLQNDPATQVLTAPDNTQIFWQRGGTGPELTRVMFDLSTDGGASWNSLGSGTRIGTTADWQINGLALPDSGQFRARGITTGGYLNGSSGLIAQTTAFPASADTDHDGLFDTWELAHWPTTIGHGPADDFDQDGYNELLELALGLNPTVSNPGDLPAVVNEGGYLTMTLSKQPGVNYEVQSAGTVLPAVPDSFGSANTTVLVNDATTLKARDNTLIGTGPRRFLRVKVTAAP